MKMLFPTESFLSNLIPPVALPSPCAMINCAAAAIQFEETWIKAAGTAYFLLTCPVQQQGLCCEVERMIIGFRLSRGSLEQHELFQLESSLQ